MPITCRDKKLILPGLLWRALHLLKTLLPGNSLKIKYAALGTFNASNEFIAQLSDSTGSFANAVSIGSLKSHSFRLGPINAKLPPNASPEHNTAVRVVSSNLFYRQFVWY
jgi:hypothetical protein